MTYKAEGYFENGDMWTGGRMEEAGLTWYLGVREDGSEYQTDETPTRFLLNCTMMAYGTSPASIDHAPLIAERKAKGRMWELRRDRYYFFKNTVVPTLEYIASTGHAPISPPIVGALHGLGYFEGEFTAKELLDFSKNI